MEGLAEEITVSIDNETGEYTRLTRFYPGADTASFGAKAMIIQRKFLSSVAVYLIRPLIYGWKQVIMQVDPLGNYMVLLKLMRSVLCLKFLFPTRRPG